jgi:hypothetical protein
MKRAKLNTKQAAYIVTLMMKFIKAFILFVSNFGVIMSVYKNYFIIFILMFDGLTSDPFDV